MDPRLVIHYILGRALVVPPVAVRWSLQKPVRTSLHLRFGRRLRTSQTRRSKRLGMLRLVCHVASSGAVCSPYLCAGSCGYQEPEVEGSKARYRFLFVRL